MLQRWVENGFCINEEENYQKFYLFIQNEIISSHRQWGKLLITMMDLNRKDRKRNLFEINHLIVPVDVLLDKISKSVHRHRFKGDFSSSHFFYFFGFYFIYFIFYLLLLLLLFLFYYF